MSARGTWLPAGPEADHPSLDDHDATGDPYWALMAALHAFDAWDGDLAERPDVVRGLVDAARDLVDVVWDQDQAQEDLDTEPGTVPPVPIGDELAAKYGWTSPLQRFLDGVASTPPGALEVLAPPQAAAGPQCMTCGDSGIVSDLGGNTLVACNDCPA